MNSVLLCEGSTDYTLLQYYMRNDFVDCADPEKRYLFKRRLVTKAKFDTYFSVRTSAEQFAERQNILKNIEWEKYTALQEDFKLLEKLSGEK